MTGWRPFSRGACVLACVFASFLPVVPMTAESGSAQTRPRTPFDSNLIRNGGAERGGASYPESMVGRVPGWKRSGRFTVVLYGIEGFLPKAESKRIGGRTNHFACGSVSPNGRAWQRIDLIGRGRAVDAREVAVILRAYASAPATGGDRGRFILRFLDAHSRRLGRLTSPWVSDTALRMIATRVSTVLPPRTRSIVVLLKGERKSGLFCNVYFDSVDLMIVRA